MTQCRLDVAVPEMLAEPQPHCQVEDDIDVGARFPAGRHDWRTKLDQLIGILIEAKPDAQTLALPRAPDRQDDIGKSCGRGRIEIGLNVKLEGAQRLRTARGIGVRKDEVRPEPNEPADAIRAGLQYRAVT